MKLSSKLKEERMKRNLTQIEMAALIGIGLTTYNRLELGIGAPSFEVVRKLAAYFKTNEEDIRKWL